MRHILTIFLLLIGCSAWAQNGNISGTVKTSDELPADLITVGLKGTSKGATTDKRGQFSIRNVAPGAYIIVIHTEGIRDEEQTVIVSANETVNVSITLSESAKKLEEVTITDGRNSYTDNTTSSGLRLNTPIQQLPQNVQVVTKGMLKDQQVISMSDGLIRNVSGLVRMEHWGDIYTNISARGGQVQALRNGFNVVNSYWGPLTEDMSFVDNIEFVKGPAGFMLSSGDPSGLYNVVTKKPTGQTKGEVGITHGSFDLYRGTIDLDGKLSKNGKLLYRFNAAAQNKKSSRANEYNNRYTIAPVLSYRVDDKTLVTFEYTYQRANMSNVGSYYIFDPKGYATQPVDFTLLPAGIPGTTINDHSMYLNLQHNFNDHWKVTAQGARFIYNQVGSSAWPSRINPDGTIIRNIGIWDAKSLVRMGQVFINGDITTGPVQHKILAGLDMSSKNYYADWSQSHDLDDTTDYFNLNDPKEDVNHVSNGYPVFDRSKSIEERAQMGWGYQSQRFSSVYVQDELSFWQNRIRLTLAGRYTDIKQAYAGPDDKAQHFTPRVGLSVSADRETAIYALYDQAFVPQTGMLTSGAKVKPITGNNMEIGVKRQWFNGKWFTGITAYRIIKNHELIADPTQAPTSGLSVELGQKLTEGVEFDLKGTIINGLTLVANYAYTDSRVMKVTEGVTALKEGDLVPGFSKHTANAWLNYRFRSGVLKGFGISGGCTFLGARATYWDPSPAGGATLPDYLKVDAGLSWENQKFSINANVFNLLNDYLYAGSYYAWSGTYYWQADPPRNLRLSVSYKF